LERAIELTAGRVIEKVDLPATHSVPVLPTEPQHVVLSLSLREWLNEQEKLYLLRQLEACGGKIGLTAQLCGVDVKTLYRKMRFYDLDKRTFHQKNREIDQNEALFAEEAAGELQNTTPVAGREPDEQDDNRRTESANSLL